MVGLFGTCLDLTPRYKEYSRYPTATVTKENNNDHSFILRSVKWPITYPQCNLREADDVTLCDDSPPMKNKTFYDDLKKYLRCYDPNGDLYEIESLNTKEFRDLSTSKLNISHTSENGSFCDLESSHAESNDILCDIDIINNPYVGKCFNTQGSHATMFWVYLPLRTLWQMFMSAAFALLDGTSMCLVKEYNSSYGMIIVWQSIAAIIGPLIAGAMVQDSPDANGNVTCNTI